ncbi:prepilin peptidase [Pantoea agglomerans]|nr:prepilin peptidase [Pantoea agglomerans]
MFPMLILFFFALTGVTVGSFINVIIYRLPLIIQGEALSLSFPASHCPQCKTPIKFYHLIPVIGWLMLRGRCAHCSIRVSARYPLIELLTGGLFTLAILRFGVTPLGIGVVLALIFLIPLFFIDLDTFLLPDRLTLSFLILASGASLSGYGMVSAQESVLAAAAGFGIPWLLDRLHHWRYGRNGMGMGDMKLFAALGAWTGLEGVFQIMLIASLIALVSALLLLRHKRDIAFPFGPYMVIAALTWIFCFS